MLKKIGEGRCFGNLSSMLSADVFCAASAEVSSVNLAPFARPKIKILDLYSKGPGAGNMSIQFGR